MTFALDTTIFTALSKASRQGKRRLDRECALKTAILRCPALRCSGLRLPQSNEERNYGLQT